MIRFVWSLCVRPSGRLDVCVSVLKKTMNNFWMDRQNWMKFSEVTRLLLRTAWMGSTPSQSLQGSPWPASRPFPWNLSPPWFLALPDHVISFWKAFDEANKMVQEDFWFSARIKSCGCRGGDLEGGKNFFWELCNIYKIEYFWNQILWDACFFVFWFEPPRGGQGALYKYILYRNPNCGQILMKFGK